MEEGDQLLAPAALPGEKGSGNPEVGDMRLGGSSGGLLSIW
jgi:hypothetical protein